MVHVCRRVRRLAKMAQVSRQSDRQEQQILRHSGAGRRSLPPLHDARPGRRLLAEEAMSCRYRTTAITLSLLAGLISLVCAGARAQGATPSGVIEISTPMPPPDWALLERELF